MSTYVELCHEAAFVTANCARANGISTNPERLEVRLRHQPGYGIEVRHFVPHPNAISRPRTSGNPLGNCGSWQATTAHVQTNRLWLAARTPRVSIEGKTISCAASIQRGKKLMTIRRLASAILAASVRWASPGVRVGNPVEGERDSGLKLNAIPL